MSDVRTIRVVPPTPAFRPEPAVGVVGEAAW